MKAEEMKIKIRSILVDYHRRDDYDLTKAENDMTAIIEGYAKEKGLAYQKWYYDNIIKPPPLTDEEIERWAFYYENGRRGAFDTKIGNIQHLDGLKEAAKAMQSGTIRKWIDEHKE